METTLNGPRVDDSSDGLPRMSRAQFWSVLGVGITLFLFEAGPVWRHPWDMGLVNGAIFWSYLILPLLVIGCLAWSKRLSLRAFFVDTLTLVLLKYTCTFALALVLWEVTPLPPAALAAPLPRGAAAAEIEPAAAPTPIDPARTGAALGSVTDAAGRPVAGALVWIAGGLERYTFAPPSGPLMLADEGARMTPELAVARNGQPILARSADGRLHTMVAEQDGRTLFNVPLLASGEPSRARFREAEGLVTLRCNAHPGSAEMVGRVLVLDHPFFARTDASGYFALRGVPAGRVTIAAYDGEQRSAKATIDLAAGGEARATLALGESDRAVR